MRWLYNLGIILFSTTVRIAALWNPKARLWINGRKTVFDSLAKVDLNNCIWFHCASLGEFEQARPVMEKLKAGGHRICLTFFSPSGYEIRKDYAHADGVFYLPTDTPENARRFAELIQPKLAVFVKYELWFNYLNVLKKRSVPTFLLSATFRPSHRYFKWYGTFFRKMLHRLDGIFVQESRSQDLLKSIGIESVLNGDTRYDRVVELASGAIANEIVHDFSNERFVLIAGSSWQQEELLLAKLELSSNECLIIAPHDVSQNHIRQIELRFGSACVRYSEYVNNRDCSVLIIDNIGLLGQIYQYGDAAFIGGGFTGKLHNILEPAAYGLPVCFGPAHENFPEADEILQYGSAMHVETTDDIKTFLSWVKDGHYNNALFVKERTGASERFLNHIRGFM